MFWSVADEIKIQLRGLNSVCCFEKNIDHAVKRKISKLYAFRLSSSDIHKLTDWLGPGLAKEHAQQLEKFLSLRPRPPF